MTHVSDEDSYNIQMALIRNYGYFAGKRSILMTVLGSLR
jgi:hypothetical protein